jgi:hypothetical protein
MAGLESVAALRARAGESAPAYEHRGRLWLAERRARDVMDVQRVILEEEEAERRRLQQLVHLDTIARGKRSGPHVAARKSALRLHERQREASRNKVEALTGEMELTLARATQQFQRTLKVLREAGKSACASGPVARVLASVRAEDDEVKDDEAQGEDQAEWPRDGAPETPARVLASVRAEDDEAKDDEARGESKTEWPRDGAPETSAGELAVVGQQQEPEAKDTAPAKAEAGVDASKWRSAGANTSDNFTDADVSAARGASQLSCVATSSPRTLAVVSSRRTDRPSPRTTEVSDASRAFTPRVETPKSGCSCKARPDEAEPGGALVVRPAKDTDAGAVAGTVTCSTASAGAGDGDRSACSGRPGSGGGATRRSSKWIDSDSLELRLVDLLDVTPDPRSLSGRSLSGRVAEAATEAAQAQEAADGNDGVLA